MINLRIESNPAFLDLKDIPYRAIDSYIASDSIFSFFPIAELQLSDRIGVFVENLTAVEGLQLNVSLQEDESNKILTNPFVISEYDFQAGSVGAGFSGTSIFELISLYHKLDFPKSFAFEDKIDNIVKRLLSPYEGIKTGLISQTRGVDIWYQANEPNSLLIEKLSEVALNSNKETSPFYTFINLQNEFYFATLEDLLNQKPVNTFTLEDENVSFSLNKILEYDLTFMGYAYKKADYKKKFYYTNSEGKTINKTADIKDFMVKQGKNGKLAIRKNDINYNQTSFEDLGFMGATTDDNNLKGVVASYYKNSAISYRMSIVVNYADINMDISAGKTIALKFDGTAFPIKAYSGNWLVLQSDVYYDYEAPRGVYAKLLLGRSSLNIDSTHILNHEFIEV